VPHLRPVAPDTGARIPASFTIPAGNGQLTPPVISVPKSITIDLRVRNQDSRAHTVQFEAPKRYTLQLAAGASAGTTVAGLPDATYRLLIDGSAKGQIIVGSVPGP
jgi:hypothetical protein